MLLILLYFFDDHVSIKKGFYKEFENLLIEHDPAVGVPLCDIVKKKLVNIAIILTL